MDVTQLALTRVGWPNGEKLALFGCERPNGVARRPKFSTCVYLRLRLARALHDWFKKLAPFFHQNGSKTKTNRNSSSQVFARFTSAAWNYFEIWLVHWNAWILCDWLERLLWFWFYDTQPVFSREVFTLVLFLLYWSEVFSRVNTVTNLGKWRQNQK